jgi:phosphoribosylpyrophosphate synthetase
MKKSIKILMLLTFSYFLSINSSFAAVEDTQVIDKLNDTNTTNLQFDFKLKKFESCEDMSNVLTNYMKKYYNQRPIYYR